MGVSGQSAAANWSGTRFFAVDYDAGSDSAKGYSDVSMAAAGLVAVKTWERLLQLLPKFGNGRRATIAIASRAAGATYRNPADTADADLVLANVYGYEYLCARGTGTDATAASVKFANDAAERVFAGARRVTGTNAAGYNPVAPITANTFDVQLAGGGAPALAAEPGLIGKRIRFDAATTTVALRNATAFIWSNDADTMTVGPDLPAVPVAADIFYIEEPGVAFSRVQVKPVFHGNLDLPVSALGSGIYIAGIRSVDVAATQAFRVSGPAAAGSVSVSFCDVVNANAGAFTAAGVVLGIGSFFLFEDGGFAMLGSGLRAGGIALSIVPTFFISEAAVVGAARFFNLVTATGNGTLSGNCYSAAGVTVNIAGSVLVGNAGSATVRPLRCVGGTGGRVLRVTSTNGFTQCALNGIDVQGAGANDVIEVSGLNQVVRIANVTGSTGNTGAGLDLTGARYATIHMDAGDTFTGAAGRDIEGAGPVRYVHADYARTDLTDNAGNRIIGIGGAKMGPAAILTNNAAAGDIPAYSVVRCTAGGLVQGAQANNAANATGVVGVTQSPMTAAGTQVAEVVQGGGTWIQFDGAPVAGAIAYLSVGVVGQATTTIPPLAATNQKLRLGRVTNVSGTLGFVTFVPELLPVVADGLA